jgi:leucyl-tRNA synthetase
MVGMEEKWRKRWQEAKLFEAKEGMGKKYYVLEMYPYPSGVAGHVGHVRNYMIGDSFVRFMRMNGYNVLYPMGWDAFGQPSENAAIQLGIHPIKSIEQNIKNFKEQLNQLSISYDWSREISTCDPEYYKWNQWLFIKLFEKGLAYKSFALGNWCPACKTVLANEDVKEGKCWRCETEVIQREINQWFFKITDYADRLLEDLDKIDWSDRLKTMQRNWIGKSHGINYIFKIKETGEEIKTFTTRPDTFFGITFMVIAPEHPMVKELVKESKNKKEIKKFVEEAKKLSELERTMLTKEKKGIFTGMYAINPVTEKEIPIWIANYVVGTYGTGVVIGVPTQDQRDFEFAKKYGIGLKNVINPPGKELKEEEMQEAYTEEGIMTNSQQFDGMKSS